MTTTATTAPPSFLATRRGKLTLFLLGAAGFLDFVDASIVNVALPHIRDDLDFSVQHLQWVISGYLLTYGGFMLLGGRMADILGRRRVLVSGTLIFAVSSLIGGAAQDAGVLVGARMAQGLGAALMVPAALSILTTSFVGPERHKVLAVWGGIGGLGSAVGVLLGGLLTEGPGWRWVLYVNPPIAVLLLFGMYALLPNDGKRTRVRDLDLVGALLVTGGMLLLVYGLVQAPDQGWGSTRTILELGGAGVVLAVFVVAESRMRQPLIPLSVFRVPGLAAADVTGLIGVGGFITMFFFLTLYMQNLLGYSAIETGLAYLPLTFGVGISAGISSGLIGRIGTKPIMVTGALITAAGLAWLSRIPDHGSYVADLLPGLLLTSLGIGGVFVGTTTAANAGVPPRHSGLAAALVNASAQVGGALGLAIFSAIATSRTNGLLANGTPPAHALTSGFERALVAAGIALVVAAVVALWTKNARGEHEDHDDLEATGLPTAA
jgi:EmrB/QacA subfamily drug resistance transporter